MTNNEKNQINNPQRSSQEPQQDAGRQSSKTDQKKPGQESPASPSRSTNNDR